MSLAQDPTSHLLRPAPAVGVLGFLVTNVSHGNIHHPALAGDLLHLGREIARFQAKGRVGIPALPGGSAGWGTCRQPRAGLSAHQDAFPGFYIFSDGFSS